MRCSDPGGGSRLQSLRPVRRVAEAWVVATLERVRLWVETSQFQAEIADVILRCSAYFERCHDVLRECYEIERYERGFLADPEPVR